MEIIIFIINCHQKIIVILKNITMIRTIIYLRYSEKLLHDILFVARNNIKRLIKNNNI